MEISTDLLLARHIGEENALKIMADAGFTHADFTLCDFAKDDSVLNTDSWKDHVVRIRDYAASLGISFNQAHAPFEFNWEEPNVIEEKVIPRTIRCLEAASIAGVDTVIVHPLHYKNYFHNMDEVWDDNINFFSDLLPFAKEYNVRICLENLFQFDSRKVALQDTCADAGRYIKALDYFNDPHLVGCVDVGHALLVGDDPAELIRKLGHDRVKALHIHDNKRVVDDHVMPFLGNLNWDDLCKALADIDYDGVFTFESFLFFDLFEKDFYGTAAKWLHDMGIYLTNKIERYKEQNNRI